ncbi:MAG: UvrD-helicase domain-containing protein [Pricia sp.]
MTSPRTVSPFQIFNASAGSGKTHSLTKAYLKIVLSSSGSYRRILAITFTNKAVAEMKHRILDSLFRFSQIENPNAAPPLFHDLMEELRMDAPTLREKARVTLKDILHNYAFFDISTIDRFTHRLIRTFAKDLKLPQNFEVVLDTDLLLDEAVARLLQKAGTDKKLTRTLLDFALEKIDDDKSWDISFDLIKIGKLLFNENHAKHLENLGEKNIDDFLGLKRMLRQRSAVIGDAIIATASKALEVIDSNGLEASDFTRKSFPNFLQKITEGDLKMDFTAGWKQDFESTTLYNKSAPESTKAILDGLHPEFTRMFDQIKEGYYQMAFLKNAYQNIVPLTVLNAIRKEVKALQAENEQLSISEFNTLISQEIKNQPAPFIYERLGEKYRHYFIDEFQDTSALQWNNLVPLIGNALESQDMQGRKGSLFLVGDAKQAIYRWRGGRAEQFLNLVSGIDNPFVASPEIADLPVNYRSREEVVKFNNEFFTVVSPILNNALYSEMFTKGNRQGYNDKKGGYVEIRFVEEKNVGGGAAGQVVKYDTEDRGSGQNMKYDTEDDAEGNGEKDKNELYCEAVLQTIRSVGEKGYGYGEVCILVRGNKDGVLLADFLARQDIPTISSESLLLNGNAKVRFLEQLLTYADNPLNRENAFGILSYLSHGFHSKYDSGSKHEPRSKQDSDSTSESTLSQRSLFSSEPPERKSRHDFIYRHLNRVPQLLRKQYGFELRDLERMSVYDGMEKAIKCFDLAPSSDAFITYFMDEVLQVEQSEGAGLQAFLAHWDKKKDRLALSAPENIDAVRIMTIHKAKGLEFPIVIFPFANENIYKRMDKKLWLPVVASHFNGFDELLVNEKKELEHYGETASELYYDEEHKMELDALNVLYVALTRAETALYILSEKDLTSKREHKTDRYSGLFIDFLQKKGLWNDESTYSFGHLEANTASSEITGHESIPYRYTYKDRPGFRILTRSGRLWNTEREAAISRGNLIHYILGLVETEKDIRPAFENVLRNGDISEDDIDSLETTIRQVTGHPELVSYYTDGNTVKNEKDIITANGRILRPDRINIQGNQAILIDYKTGRPDPKYKEQLYDYADALADMGYAVEQRIIVYINDTVRVERV